jgi:REP element-mobilizing transposase RayT
MKYDPQKHHRRTIRLKGHDYTSPGAYFITICTHQRQCLFGKIVDGKMQLNEFGNWVDACWKRLPTHFSHLQLDRFVVMPNHIHGILVLTHNPNEPTPTNGRGAAFGRTSMQLFTMLRPNATPGSEDRSQFANPDCPNPIYPNATPGSEDRSQFTNPDCPDPIYPNATPGSEDRSHFVDPVCSDTLPNSDQPSMNESESDMAFGREMVALVGCVPFHNPIANPTFIMERTIPN